MDNKDFSNLGEQIRDSVQDAIDSMDFKQLNRTISNTVNSALDEARSQMMKGLDAAKRKEAEFGGQSFRGSTGPGYRAFQTSETAGDSGNPYRVRKPAGNPAAIRLNQSGRISGILFTVFGGIGLGLVGILFLVTWLLALVAKPLLGAVLGSSAILLVLGGVFGVMLGKGISTRGRLKRAGLYLKQAGSRLYCDIGELARSMGKTKKFVVRDLQKMIEKGILPEAHIDEQKTCLMLNEETYRQYLEAQKALKQRERELALLAKEEKKQKKGSAAAADEKKRAEAEAETAERFPEGLREMIAQGQEHLRVIREANDAIPGEVISGKISRLENVIERIFETVERKPEQMEEMERFMDYYLPTTVKLVKAYRDFDRVEIEGDNIVSAKHEIEETLDTINTAFERLLDDLYQDDAMDITTDASVLQTMLKKDGFAESDFNRREES